ncbi:MAG: GNAT family N-acetyltransferase [Actinocatenispora sp.]
MKTLAGPAAYEPATELLREYVAELALLMGDFDAGRADLAAEARTGTMTVACADDGTPVGCVAVRVIAPGVAEVKRMYVRPEARGAGLGAEILALAERIATEQGCPTVRLDTAVPPLHTALRLYRRHGYREIPPYNENPSATHWLEKRLDAAGPARTDG